MILKHFLTRVSVLLLSYAAMIQWSHAQVGNINSSLNNMQLDNQGRPMAKQTAKDSLVHRDPYSDSITVTYRMFDSMRQHHLDTSINDFKMRMPAPFTYTDLGNPGSPANSLLFQPYMQAGWDPGIHVMDPYRLTVENTRYYTATRPYTDLTYIMGSQSEQFINLLHTQNRNSKVNFSFEFNLTGAPGAYKNQNANNSNMRFNIASQSKDKRYSINFLYIANSMKPSANGGIVNREDLDNDVLGDPFYLATKLSSSSVSNKNPFKTNVTTGNVFSDNTVYLQHSYDFGQKDSIVKDSVTTRIFYPRLRFQHSLKYASYNYKYIDVNPVTQDYLTYFNYIAGDTVQFKDTWKELTNELAIITYPDKKNQAQFFKIDGGWQYLHGAFGENLKHSYTNLYAGAEYRNTTRNKLWDLEAVGKLFLTGTYAGDYSAFVSLKRNVRNIGALQIGLHNVNKTLPFVFNASGGGKLSFDTTGQDYSVSPHTDFPVTGDSSWNKENITRIFAQLDIDALKVKLTGNYYLVTNYGYFDGYFSARQYAPVFNILQVGASKETRLGKYFKWYADLYLQQKAGGAPLNVPLLLMRHRIAFEGNFFHNLYIATGFDVRYVSPYKADDYSPFTGQYFYQTDEQISNRPDVAFYLNFRITHFRFFSELANLNTMNYSKTKGFGFNAYNYTAPNYPQQGMWFRFGFKWSFVN